MDDIKEGSPDGQWQRGEEKITFGTVLSQENEKPVPPRRRKKEKDSANLRKTANADENQTDNSSKEACGDPAEKGQGSSNGEYLKSSKKFPLEFEAWKVNMLLSENIGFNEKKAKISTQKNKIIIEGEDSEVRRISSVILDREQNIIHRQIVVPDDQNVKDFLKKEAFYKYVREVMCKEDIILHWELNEADSLIDLYVNGEEKSMKAYEILKRSYHRQSKSRLNDVILQHLCKSELWQKKIDEITKMFDDKVTYIVNHSSSDLTVLCTSDLAEVAVDRLNEMEKALRAGLVLHLNEKMMLLLKTQPKVTANVKMEILPEQKCIVFYGKQEDVLEAKINVKCIASQFKHAEVHGIPLTLVERASVKNFLNERLERENLNIHWKLNKGTEVIDLYMENDEKLKFVHDIIKKSFCTEKMEFKNTSALERFLSFFINKTTEKVNTIRDGNTVVVECTVDLHDHIKHLQKQCQENIITSRVAKKSEYTFIKQHPAYVEAIEEKYSVSIEFLDADCNLVIKGTEDKPKRAKEAIDALISEKVSAECIPISQERFLKFRNRDDVIKYTEIEQEFDVHIELQEVPCLKFDFYGNDILVTNNMYPAELNAAVLVPKNSEFITVFSLQIHDAV